MHRRLLPAALTGLLLVFSVLFAACGGDEDKGGTTPNLDTDQGLATAMVTDVVLPLFEKLNLAGYFQYLPAQRATLGFNQCQPLEGCSSGSAEVCPLLTGIQVNFADCVVEGIPVNGSLTLEGTATEGTVSILLAFGDVALTSEATYTVTESCVGISIVQATVNMPSVDATLLGYMQYCNPPAMIGQRIVPTYASLFIDIPARDRAVDVNVHNDPPGALTLTVQNLARNEFLLFCDGILYGGISCSRP